MNATPAGAAAGHIEKPVEHHLENIGNFPHISNDRRSTRIRADRLKPYTAGSACDWLRCILLTSFLMKNLAVHVRIWTHPCVRFAVVGLLCCVGIACHPAAPNSPTEAAQEGMEQPLKSFRQVLTSSKTDLKLHPGEDTKIPVRIQNPGTETWEPGGRYPVTVSYKWYKDGQMLRIEGERTMLPSAVGPNQTVEADVRVVAPADPGNYTLRVTLVQEAVAWFLMKSNTFLELPATVR